MVTEGILDRDADEQTLDREAQRLANGRSVLELCQSLVASGEAAGGEPAPSAEELAHRLYRGILSRNPDPGGLTLTVDQIERSCLAEGAAEMLRSREFSRRFLWDV